MRLILQATDPIALPPADQWVLFNANGNFSIAPYITAGYNTYDAWIVGGGGGGGGGARGRSAEHFGGGGGGGGGGGSVRRIIAQDLLSLPGNAPVVVGLGGAGGPEASTGSKGGDSIFNGITAYGGGAGSGGKAATSTALGPGGGGGSGGGRNGKGNNGGAPTQTVGGAAGAAQTGGGAGGKGASYNTTGFKGLNASQYTDDTDFGGGGGGGGGRGTKSESKTNVYAHIKGGNGGIGDRAAGGPTNGIYTKAISTSTFGGAMINGYGGGMGGGGGGGVNLFDLCAYPGLTGTGGSNTGGSGGKPGGGGLGGGGSYSQSIAAKVGRPGGQGCVLIHVYIL
jgi:hypothetical protein